MQSKRGKEKDTGKTFLWHCNMCDYFAARFSPDVAIFTAARATSARRKDKPRSVFNMPRVEVALGLSSPWYSGRVLLFTVSSNSTRVGKDVRGKEFPWVSSADSGKKLF